MRKRRFADASKFEITRKRASLRHMITPWSQVSGQISGKGLGHVLDQVGTRVSKLAQSPDEAGAERLSLLTFLPAAAGRSRRAAPTAARPAMGLTKGGAPSMPSGGDQTS